MSFLNQMFRKGNSQIKNYDDFWNWFKKNQEAFLKVIKKGKNIEKGFFGKMSPKLDQVRKDIFFLCGMFDNTMAELILTADGEIKNIVFVEEIVRFAPELENWKFTALKPAQGIESVGISIDNYSFQPDNLSFYSVDYPKYPDEIEIAVVYNNYVEEDKSTISTGVYIFLDNYLGELNFATDIDILQIIGTQEAKKELIPIEKLKSFLVWRQKEFVEKYEGTRYNTENDTFASFESKLKDGPTLLAIINTDLLNWDRKASHPWVVDIEIKYTPNENGMPDSETYEKVNEIETKILNTLKDRDGYLNIGHETGDGLRSVFLACKEFRKPSLVIDQIQKEFGQQFEIDFNIYKDKYWQSFNRFLVV